MTNSWNIPKWLEQEVRARDTKCVYCGVNFTHKSLCRKTTASWEHIINDAKIVTRENIALCCCSCNSSKGAKPVTEWFKSIFCTSRNINQTTVATVVQLGVETQTKI